MYKWLFKLLGFLDIPSDIIIGLWSISMLLGCIYSIYKTGQISYPIATIFCCVITNFGAHRVATIIRGPTNLSNVVDIQDKNVKKELDCQGDN